MICKLDIAFVVDKSVSHPNWLKVKHFLINMIDTLEGGNRSIHFASVFFASQASTAQWFDTCGSKQCMKNIINSVTPVVSLLILV